MKLVDEEILKQNPWYVDSQIDTLQIPAYYHTFVNRWDFISKELKKERKSSQHKLKVLDAGCGDGINLIQLSKENNIDLFALDYNSIRVERAKEKFNNVDVFQDDLTEINENLIEKFDVILCSQVIEHIPNYETVIKNLHKYLNSNGLLILGTPNEGCYLARLRNNVFEPNTLKNSDHIHFFKINEFVSDLKKQNYIIENTYIENFFYPRSKWFVKMGETEFKRKISRLLMQLFPSQVAGFYISIRKH